ncbi:MAG: GSCFA domain-containing protein [Bacteroidales bacterium]|jgi:hypothetical protein|nr:GSCFA domain-containing protein [Bacteroidales bacterium]
MKFSTEVNVEKSCKNINHQTKIMLLGSCFSQNIGEKLNIGGFKTMINPFGTVYNPFSISEILDYISQTNHFTEKDIIQNGDVFKLLTCHGDIFGYSSNEVLSLAQKKQQEASQFLTDNSLLILTLGTAWTYTYVPQNRIMANCHKIDTKLISRKMLSVSDIVEIFSKSLETFKHKFNCDVIITISPVRHWREGYRDNLLSKSVLHLAVNELCKYGMEYFPAYEIMFDELRDYRFYADDLLHPNNLAVNIMWEKFSNTYFDINTKELSLKFEKLYSMKNHKPLYPKSQEYLKHLKKIESLEKDLSLLVQ